MKRIKFIIVMAAAAISVFLLVENKAAKADEARDKAAEEIGGDCAMCHMNLGMQPSYRDEKGVLHDLFVDADLFKQSVHYTKGELTTCLDCHSQKMSKYPHPEETISCFDCHDDDAEFGAIETGVAGSVHSKFLAENCVACHSAHYMKPAAEKTLVEKNFGCIQCHDISQSTGVTLVQRHSWHVQAALHLSRIACVACHTRPDGKGAAFKHKILPASQAVKECMECHTTESRLKAYKEDVGQACSSTCGTTVGSGQLISHLAKIGEPLKTAAEKEKLLEHFYISGVTTEKRIDFPGLILIALAAAGAAGHGLIRIYSRRKKP
jgi:hypothetical protein